MRSKHVVQVFDVINSGSELGIVEEFIDGFDLWETDFPRKSLLNYLKTLWQIASGLADIHEVGIVHRDIKPNNMKLDAEGVVKIYDFGLAREDGPKAKTRGFIGTIGFSAPEQYRVTTAVFSRAVDVYAFGATAYYLATADLPDELKEAPPEPLPAKAFSLLGIGLPEELAVLFTKCLARDPGERPEMSAVRDAIAKYLLRDRHQALVVYNNVPTYLNAQKRSIKIEFGRIGEIEIGYDGLQFQVKSARGEAFINNQAAVPGMEIPGSCVVALGNSSRRSAQRTFVTFDVSNPEVII
jgi:serine/threonine-protein kinase